MERPRYLGDGRPSRNAYFEKKASLACSNLSPESGLPELLTGGAGVDAIGRSFDLLSESLIES
jgi:hypothetical protein